TIAFVGGVLNGRGTAEPDRGGPAQVLASSGRHVMMRCVGRDGDDGLRRSENVAAEIAEEEKPSPLNALNRLRLSSSFAPPLLSSSRADGGRGEAARPSRRHAPVDAEEEPPPPLTTRAPLPRQSSPLALLIDRRGGRRKRVG
uniref:Uncharacterized protein n=1 Tax=Oryza glaberrima TaxID=4538 RepID=I1Q6P9_ORYGL